MLPSLLKVTPALESRSPVTASLKLLVFVAAMAALPQKLEAGFRIRVCSLLATVA